MARAKPASTLLELPDPCLVAVLRCCNDDQHCLFSAARAHGRLHQAAVLALSSIKAISATQQQADSMLQYLEKHGQHLDSISISGDGEGTFVLPLPSNLRLSSMQLDSVGLQLQPGHGLLGVLGPTDAVAALTQLRLTGCTLRDSTTADALAAAMWQLPEGMQHLSITCSAFRFPAGVCRQLQHLTHLDIAVPGLGSASSKQQDIQALTRLVDLRLCDVGEDITVDMLSGMQHLTRLEFSCESMDLSVLDGRTQLQHLALGLMIADAQVAQLLSHLRYMQQLTYLNLSDSMSTDEDGDDNPPAIAYAALTASSKLAHLDISWCSLPADAWKHMLSAGRQLPHLHYLSIENLDQPSGDEGIPPRGSSLVRCCPNLQSLDLRDMRCSVKLLAALPRLTRLSSLRLAHSECKGKGLEVLSQLTGLQELHAQFPFSTQQGLLLQLTQLKQLTQLVYEGRLDGAFKSARFSNQAPGDEPVWRQVLQLHLDHSDPAVAQQAAAALAE